MAERLLFALMVVVGGLAAVDLSYALGLDSAISWATGAIIAVILGGVVLRIFLCKTRPQSRAEDRI